MNKIKEYRQQMSLTRQHLAEKIGVTTTTIYYIENGRNPSLGIAFKLANFFNVSIEDLFPQFNTKRKTPAGV